ncbi:hypothetical protein CGZ80_24030 [Rhodopirellula sp. MGV]|nr:hypothetical protein CGZ80_24030 [Rhodopirellula sp. MGV]PNY33743.1 hypothetical protein C2E31_27005 [Rhodopirellula baltica]
MPTRPFNEIFVVGSSPAYHLIAHYRPGKADCGKARVFAVLSADWRDGRRVTMAGQPLRTPNAAQLSAIAAAESKISTRSENRCQNRFPTANSSWRNH